MADITLKHTPRVSEPIFSLSCELGKQAYDIIVEYGLDPGAVFALSKSLGALEPRVKKLHNWGLLRRPYRPDRAVSIIGTSVGPLVRYQDWETGLRDWCEVLVDLYIGRLQLNTVEGVIFRASERPPSHVYHDFLEGYHGMGCDPE